MLGLRCIYLGSVYPQGSMWTLNETYPVCEAAERDPLTGQEALRWVRVTNSHGGTNTLERFPDGTYGEYGRGARFVLTLHGGA